MSEPSTDDPQPLRPAIATLSVARLVVNTLERAVYPFLPAIARGLGIPLERAGLLLSVRSGASIGLPVAVRLLGGGGRQRRQMTVALVVVAVGAGILVGPWGFTGAVVGFAAMGLGKVTYDNGAQTYLAQRTGYERRARVLGYLELTFAGGLLVGAPLFGLLIDRFDWRTAFVVVAFAALGMVTVVRRVTEPGHPAGIDEPERLRLEASGRSLLLVAWLYMVAIEVSFVSVGAWMEDDLGLGLVGIGGLSFLLGGSELVAEVFVITRADSLGKRRTTLLGMAIAALGFTLLALVGNGVVLGIGTLAIALFGFEVAIVATIPLASELVPTARGAFLALFGVAIMAGRSVGALLGPWLYVRHGMDTVALTSAGLYVVAMLLLVRFVADDRPAA